MRPNQMDYRIKADVQWRPATCEEIGCAPYLDGWQVRVEGLTPELVHTARTSGRKFTEVQVAEGETYLVFEAGQACFKASQHQQPVAESARFAVLDIDGLRRRHSSADSWADDLRTHQDQILGRLD